MVQGQLSRRRQHRQAGPARDKILKFTGKARCSATADDAMDALKGQKIVPGRCGRAARALACAAGPGMGMASRVVFALDGAGLGADVAFVTDGQLSGLVNKGLVIGEVTPGSGDRRPRSASVQDGDTHRDRRRGRTTIELDVPDG